MTIDGLCSEPGSGRLAGWREIFGDENVLVLATHPGDETALFGGFIARACAAGRPPFVAVLTDGSGGGGGPAQAGAQAGAQAVAMRRERETRAAVARLGLDAERLLFVGLFDGSVPTGGGLWDAVVAAIDLVMWRNDCHVLCAASGGDGDTAAAASIAHAVVLRTGLRLVLRAGPGIAGGRVLDAREVRGAVQGARDAHRLVGGEGDLEAYFSAGSV